MIYYKRARYARSHYASCYSLILVLGFSALGKGENYLWQYKFKELALHQKYLSRDDIGINNLRISETDYPSRTVEITLLAQFWNLFTF